MLRVYHSNRLDVLEALMEFIVERQRLDIWLYRQLENEYDWLTSDAAVDEAIHINAYTFTEAGLHAG